MKRKCVIYKNHQSLNVKFKFKNLFEIFDRSMYIYMSYINIVSAKDEKIVDSYKQIFLGIL